MKATYVLVDFENVPVTSLASLKGPRFHFRIFLGPNNTRLATPLVKELLRLGEQQVQIIQMAVAGKNALDSCISHYLGRLVSEDPEGAFRIISNDHDFDPLIQHLQSEKVDVQRQGSLEKMVPQPKMADEALFERVFSHLRKTEAAARPASQKALLNQICSLGSRDPADPQIQSVLNELLRKRLVRINGTKVEYPSAAVMNKGQVVTFAASAIAVG